MAHLLVEQEAAPRMDWEAGVDYGKVGKILARRGTLQLVWRPGGSVWNGMTGNSYSPTSLVVLEVGRRYARSLHEGGRLSKRLIRSLASKIDQVFGDGVAADIDNTRTLVLDPL